MTGDGKKENKTLLPQAGELVQSVGLDEVRAWVDSIKLARCIVYLGCTQVHYIYIYTHPHPIRRSPPRACSFGLGFFLHPRGRGRLPVHFHEGHVRSRSFQSLFHRRCDGMFFLFVLEDVTEVASCAKNCTSPYPVVVRHPGHQLCTATSQD
jgi:hypothetical protein